MQIGPEEHAAAERALLMRLAVAHGAEAVAEAIAGLVDDGLADAVAVYGAPTSATSSRPRLAARGAAATEAPGHLRGADIHDHPAYADAVWVGLDEREGDGAVVVLWGLRATNEPMLQVSRAAFARGCRSDENARDASVFRTAIPLLSDGMLVVTTDGELRHYGPAIERMVGWTEAEVRERGWTNLVYDDPVEREAVTRALAALVLGQPSRGVVRRLTSRGGARRDVAISSAFVPDPARGAPIMVGVLRDHTPDREARARADRDESLTRLGRLAGGIAHDFNNLLCAVMGHAELVQLFAEDPGRVRQHADTIVGAAERGAALSRELLAFAGAATPRPTAVDVADTARAVVELLRPRVPDGVGVELAVDGEVPAAEVDAGQLHQALMNTIRNAADALGDSGRIQVRVRATSMPADVTFRSAGAPEPGADVVELVVRDDGAGFAPAILERPFEPFLTTKAGGHGLGLAALRGIAVANDAALRLANDGGAVVTCWLPVSRRPELTFQALAEETPATGARVWVLDDQAQVLEFSRVSLGARGYQVRAFGAVGELARAARQTPPDGRPHAVVLDRVMPDGGGPAAHAALREAGVAAPILWVSGHVPEQDALPVGASFLPKPYTGAELADAVAALLAGR